LGILTSVSVAVVVAVWGLLINLVVLYHLQEVSHFAAITYVTRTTEDIPPYIRKEITVL
jgi:hypothetical protein